MQFVDDEQIILREWHVVVLPGIIVALKADDAITYGDHRAVGFPLHARDDIGGNVSRPRIGDLAPLTGEKP